MRCPASSARLVLQVGPAISQPLVLLGDERRNLHLVWALAFSRLPVEVHSSQQLPLSRGVAEDQIDLLGLLSPWPRSAASAALSSSLLLDLLRLFGAS